MTISCTPELSYTPASIVEKNLLFSIPLYQRLFEWDEDNITVLLDDFHTSYINDDQDYYIGLLTAKPGGDLVDGQQRFTVLMLLGCILRNYDQQWEGFLKDGDKTRLTFTSRPDDMDYLERVISKNKYDFQDGCINLKMQRALKTIDDYFSKRVEEKEKFSAYIFKHVRFFISTLPEGYSPRALNKYFERMNSTGKDLEQHEILKVELLKKLNNSDCGLIVKLWNKISEVDTELLSINSRLCDRIDILNSYDLEKAICCVNDNLNGTTRGGKQKSEIESSNKRTIGEIEPSDKRAEKIAKSATIHRCSLFQSSYFLLSIGRCRMRRKKIPVWKNFSIRLI